MPSKHSQTSRVAPNYTYGLPFNVPRYWPISYIHHITLRVVKSDDLIHMHHNYDCFTDKMHRVNWHRICTVSTWTREFEPTTPSTLPLGIIYGSCRTRSSNLILLMKILIYGILIQVNWQIKVNGIFSYVNTLRPRQNDRHFADDVFKCIFLNENIWFFYYNFTEVSSYGSDWKQVSIGSGNNLAPIRQHAIIWTNADPSHWRIYAALGGDELTICIAIIQLVFPILSDKKQWFIFYQNTAFWRPKGSL